MQHSTSSVLRKLDEGTDRMKEIAAAIRVGANAFITYEYKIIAVVVVIIAIAFAAIFTVQYGEFSWEPSVCFMIGVNCECISRLGRYEDCYYWLM